MPQRVLDDLWHSHWGLLLGHLMARFNRADLVEDALAEAFAQAASQWPAAGVPHNPPGWLRTTAHRRVLDALRHERTIRSKAHLIADDDVQPGPEDAAAPGGVTSSATVASAVDERLPLLFMATHPALAEEVRPALALRFVLGVPTAEIARLFLVPSATMAARLTRAKKRLAGSGIAFAIPDRNVWPDRLDDVARAIYLAFTAGYAPGGGHDVVRAQQAGEVVRLADLATDLLPGRPVLEALVALVRLQHARRDARVSPEGALVRLADQDRSRWHGAEIAAGLDRLTALSPTDGLAEELRLQALIAAFHATATRAADTDWAGIVRAYTRLEALTGSPIVRLNRAVAVGEASGAMAGLAILRAAADELPGHHRVALVRAELLHRGGQAEAARQAYLEAIEACPDGAERDHIRARLVLVSRA
ncbi:RNA polymerase sigma factor [Pseudactinotalea sp. Z1732]|uniref:RNA polymerase sigma factor n=1 Tax=Micrococcales TaxID=85006 RepID=UPI003C79FDD5